MSEEAEGLGRAVMSARDVRGGRAGQRAGATLPECAWRQFVGQELASCPFSRSCSANPGSQDSARQSDPLRNTRRPNPPPPLSISEPGVAGGHDGVSAAASAARLGPIQPPGRRKQQEGTRRV